MRCPIVFRIALLAVVAAIAPRLASGQAPGFSGVAGTVVDSIHGVVPLPGATVKVGNTNRQAVTDANGRFQIDSIPPGEHSLTVVHPLLDTLNVGITTRPVAFSANAMSTPAIGQAPTVTFRSPLTSRVSSMRSSDFTIFGLKW